MGATYSLGIVASTIEADSPRDHAIATLASIAKYTGVAVRDLLDGGEVVEVAPNGAVITIDGAEAEEIRSLAESSSGFASYDAFEYLDGYHVLIPGTKKEGTPKGLPEGVEIHVGPLAAFTKKLDQLIAKSGMPQASHALHQQLRAITRDAERLRVPMTLGG